VAIYEIGKNLIIVKYSALDSLRSAHPILRTLVHCACCSAVLYCRVFFQRTVFCAASRDQLFRASFIFADFLVSGHLGEGLVQLLSDGLELVLLAHQLVLQPVNLHTRIHQKHTLMKTQRALQNVVFHYPLVAKLYNCTVLNTLLLALY
jgi:hypothetical protein